MSQKIRTSTIRKVIREELKKLMEMQTGENDDPATLDVDDLENIARQLGRAERDEDSIEAGLAPYESPEYPDEMEKSLMLDRLAGEMFDIFEPGEFTMEDISYIARKMGETYEDFDYSKWERMSHEVEKWQISDRMKRMASGLTGL
jgi:hypothetical protein